MQDANRHWEDRFDRVEDLVRRNANLARRAAIEAANEVAVKLKLDQSRALEQTRADLARTQEIDRVARKQLHDKVDILTTQMGDVLTCLSKLSTTKLIQTAITSLVLASMVVIMIKVLGG